VKQIWFDATIPMCQKKLDYPEMALPVALDQTAEKYPTHPSIIFKGTVLSEMCVRGPQAIAGYWNRADETADVLRPAKDGGLPRLHTGDIATIDEDAFFRIVDRKKDVILGVSGLNIYPREIEDLLYTHRQIAEAAVVGLPVEGKGERAKAFVVLRSGEICTSEEILAFCRQNLAPYKVPKFVEFRDHLPKIQVGKVLRRQLVVKQAATTDNTAEDEADSTV
jgi:long-chain acyl-CoA synthetase